MREPHGYAKKLLPGSGIKESGKPIQSGIIFTQFISYNFDYHYYLMFSSEGVNNVGITGQKGPLPYAELSDLQYRI